MSFNSWWGSPNSGCYSSISYNINPSLYNLNCIDDAGTTGSTVAMGSPDFGRNWARPTNGYTGVGLFYNRCEGTNYGKRGILWIK